MELQYKTLYAYLSELADRCPDRKLLGDARGWYTAEAVRRQVGALGRYLHRMGIRKGDYVAVRSYRTTETALMILALQTLGSVTVLTDPRKEITEFLADWRQNIPLRAQIDGSCLTDCR